MRIAVPAIVAFVFLAPACNSTPTAPSATSTTPTIVTELFTGNITTAGSSFYSFSVSLAGTVSVMLATTTSEAGQPLTREIALGMGTPSGTGCAVTTSVTATAALASQLTSVLSAGTYCVDVSDPGTLTDPVTFNIRIRHP